MRKGWFLVAAMVVAALLIPQAVLAAVGSFSSSNATPAVTGTNTMTGTNQAPGGRFHCTANGCRGVYATSNGTSGGSYGVYASAKDPTGRALAGFNTATTGTAIGLSGQSHSTTGRGLNGLALANVGANYGGFLETKSRSSGAAGVFGWASNPATAAGGAGTNYGVYGRNDGGGEEATGVFGRATATSGDPITNGVWGDAPSANGTGVYGSSLGGIGVVGIGGASGLFAIGGGIGVGGQTGAVGDGSYGVMSVTDTGIGGHLMGVEGNLVGTCATPVGAGPHPCSFATPFPSPPLVIANPLDDPNSGTWWISSITTDGFTITKSSSGTAADWAWIAIGIDNAIGGAAPPRMKRAAAEHFE